MSVKYILIQKNTILLASSKKKTQVCFEDLIDNKNSSNFQSKLDCFSSQFSIILEKFINANSSDIGKTDNISVILDYPWTNVTILEMPGIKQRQLKKIVPFEVQKHFWQDNFEVEHNYYLIKEKKKSRIVAYSTERRILESILNLFNKLELQLASIEPYAYWLEKEIHLHNKRIKKELFVSFTNNYANIFVFDELGLKSFYILLMNNKLDSKFWKYFLFLLKRINLLENKNIKVLVEEVNKLSTKQWNILNYNQGFANLPDHTICQNLDYNDLRKIDNYITIAKNRIYLNRLRIEWNLKSLPDNCLAFFKNSILKLNNYDFQNSHPIVNKLLTFFSFFGFKFKLAFLGCFACFFLLSIIALSYQQTDKESLKLTKQYNDYLDNYKINTKDINLIKIILEQKTAEWQKASKVQKNYLKKKYTTSNLLLSLSKIKRDVPNFKIIKLTMNKQSITLSGQVSQISTNKIKDAFIRYLPILSFTTSKDNKSNFAVQIAAK